MQVADLVSTLKIFADVLKLFTTSFMPANIGSSSHNKFKERKK